MYQDEKNEIKNGLYSIGAISEVTGLSVTAIRYYSEKKLIVPSYIDESTGYRYFSSRHIWKLEVIKMYKQLGFSLSDIQELQETKQLRILEQIIEKSEQSIWEKIEEYNETLENLSWLKDQCSIYQQAKSESGFHDTEYSGETGFICAIQVGNGYVGPGHDSSEKNHKRAAGAENYPQMLWLCAEE